MKKIYHIMTDDVGEKAQEYLPGVRITRNQCPTTDCHINMKTQTNVAGKAGERPAQEREEWGGDAELLARILRTIQGYFCLRVFCQLMLF